MFWGCCDKQALRYWDVVEGLRSGPVDEGYALESFDQVDDGVMLHFTEQPSTKVRYLIDAGGVHSATRRQLRPDQTPVPLCRASYAVNSGDGEGGDLGFQFGSGAGFMTATLRDGSRWTTQTQYKNTIDLQPLENGIETNLLELPVSWTWGRGDVTLLGEILRRFFGSTSTLVGDAAHAQTPALGLGLTMAFQDVAALAAQCDRIGLSQEALRNYEDQRRLPAAISQLASRAVHRSTQVLARWL